MKTKPIITEAHCGITVELNIFDQYVLAHAVERYDTYLEQMKQHEAWVESRNKAKVWSMEKDARNEWEANNPEPVFNQIDWVEEVKPVYTFLRKLALQPEYKPTVFEEE